MRNSISRHVLKQLHKIKISKSHQRSECFRKKIIWYAVNSFGRGFRYNDITAFSIIVCFPRQFNISPRFISLKFFSSGPLLSEIYVIKTIRGSIHACKVILHSWTRYRHTVAWCIHSDTFLTLTHLESIMETCSVVLTFKCVDKILWCDHSTETFSAVFFHGAICFST